MVSLSGVSLGLVIVAAGARAYRTGMTLPEELESYDEYLTEVRLLDTLSQIRSPQYEELLLELELASERELRRFLAIKAKATFLM